MPWRSRMPGSDSGAISPAMSASWTWRKSRCSGPAARRAPTAASADSATAPVIGVATRASVIGTAPMSIRAAGAASVLNPSTSSAGRTAADSVTAGRRRAGAEAAGASSPRTSSAARSGGASAAGAGVRARIGAGGVNTPGTSRSFATPAGPNTPSATSPMPWRVSRVGSLMPVADCSRRVAGSVIVRVTAVTGAFRPSSRPPATRSGAESIAGSL